MKEIRPEDLSIHSRLTGSSDASAKENPSNNETMLNCYTGAPCDTMDKCHTKEILCDTDEQCKETAKCLETKYCVTSACGDTRTKAGICCALPTEASVCVIYTRECRDTEQCMVSRDIDCQPTELCATDDDCNTHPMCVITSICEETIRCQVSTYDICK